MDSMGAVAGGKERDSSEPTRPMRMFAEVVAGERSSVAENISSSSTTSASQVVEGVQVVEDGGERSYSNGRHQGGGRRRGGGGFRSRSNNEGWSPSKPKPRQGYTCKICGQKGGEPESHWFQLCPKYQQVEHQQQQSGNKNFQPPKKGYICKFCGKPGGEPDSHWFQQCPHAQPNHQYMKHQRGNMAATSLVMPYTDYSMMYSPIYYFPAAMQQMQSNGQLATPSHPPGQMPSPTIAPAQPGTPGSVGSGGYAFTGQPILFTNPAIAPAPNGQHSNHQVFTHHMGQPNHDVVMDHHTQHQ